MNNTVSNMNALQQLFQIAVATLSNEFDGVVDLTNGDLFMKLTSTPGFVCEIHLGNGTRTRSWFFMWTHWEGFNVALRRWMFDTLELWDALDNGVMPKVALTDQDIENLDQDLLDALESEIVGLFDENEAAFHMFQARLSARMEQEWDDREVGSQEDVDPDTGEPLLSGERAWVDPECDDRITINDRMWNAGDGLLPTGEHRDSM